MLVATNGIRRTGGGLTVGVTHAEVMEPVFCAALPDGRIACSLCPRQCRIPSDEQGFCGYFVNEAGRLHPSHGCGHLQLRVETVQGAGLAFLAGEPRPILWIETGGAVLAPHRAEPSRPARLGEDLPGFTAEELIFLAQAWGCGTIYLDTDNPGFGVTRGIETMRLARTAQLKTALGTTGYLSTRGRELLFDCLDLANFRLFSLSPAVYRHRFSARPEPIFETVEWARRTTRVAIEITIPLLLGENDRPSEIERLCRWIADSLGSATPVHFIQAGAPGTEPVRVPVRDIGLASGLRDVTIAA